MGIPDSFILAGLLCFIKSVVEFPPFNIANEIINTTNVFIFVVLVFFLDFVFFNWKDYGRKLAEEFDCLSDRGVLLVKVIGSLYLIFSFVFFSFGLSLIV